MTEHSKFPLPAEGRPEGKSLIERAEGTFGFGDLAPATVPTELAPPVNRRVRKAAPLPDVPQQGAALRSAQPAGDDGGSLPSPSQASAVAQVTPRVEFTGERRKIDRARLRENGLIEPEGAVTTLLEEFRIVKRQVLLAARDAMNAGGGAVAQRVLVCSPLPGEGKSFCAANLALAIAAEKDSEVLLVDADVGKPSILALLGLEAPEGAKGLMDALADPALRVEDCVVATDIPGLHVLPAGNRTASDSEYLASARTFEVLDRLTAGAANRIVIFDSPPALAASAAAELARHVGQALVVCRADRTGQSALEDALSLLSACPDIKLLLNAAHFSPSGRRFGAYYEGAGA